MDPKNNFVDIPSSLARAGIARGWNAHQVRGFVVEAVRERQAAWDLVPSLRSAILAVKFTEVVTGLDRVEVPLVWLSLLWQDMCQLGEEWGME